MSDGKRRDILKVCVFLIVLSFVLHYGLRGTCDGSDAVHDFFVMTFAPMVGNAGVVFTLLWWFGAPAAASMIARRHDAIEQDISAGVEARERAAAARDEARVRMAGLAAEADGIRSGYAVSAAGEAERIRRDAGLQAERMRRDSDTAFEMQAAAARRAFGAEMADMAVERARVEIEGRLAGDPALRAKLIDDGIAALEI